jgi:serine/threonine protein kinase
MAHDTRHNNTLLPAPPLQVIKSQAYGKASDVYAFGLIMWELLSWQLPYEELSSFQVSSRVRSALELQGVHACMPACRGSCLLPGGGLSSGSWRGKHLSAVGRLADSRQSLHAR